MKIQEVVKQLSHKEFYQLYLFKNSELLAKLEAGMPIDQVTAYLISKIPPNTKNPETLKGDILYTGSMARRMRQQGFELEMNENGTRSYVVKNGKKIWKLKSRFPSDLPEEQRQAFPKKVVKAFEKRGTKCALSHITIDGRPQIDHRVPIQRIKREEKFTEDISDAQIHATFMPVSANANMRKKEICNKCVQTGKRPGGTYKASVPFWFHGSETYRDTGSPGSGCKGCYWAYPEAWEHALNAHLQMHPHRPEGSE